MLKEEDETHRQMKTVGECLEFFLRTKGIEVLCAYAMIDKPKGFFNKALTVLTEIIQGINSTSLLSQSSVHPGISQLLRCIYRNLINWKFKDNGEPDMEWIHEQEPDISDCTYEILEFINTLARKVYLYFQSLGRIRTFLSKGLLQSIISH